jgi:ribonuclease HIII
MIRETPGVAFEVILIGPEKYNQLYETFDNLNDLLGWGHARVIENLLAKRPECPRALSDKFADERVIKKSLFQHGKTITLEQRTKAESDLAVAAASILAREAFIDWLERSRKRFGISLGRGVSAPIKDAARKIVEQGGPEALRKFAKVHFRTAHEIAPEHYAAPPPRREWRKSRS